MARERWFFAQGNQRHGPVLFNQLVESVLGQPEPRAVLVWRKGFADWTSAADVPEVERRLALFRARKAVEGAARRGPAPAPVEAPAPRPSARVEEFEPGSPALVCGGTAAGMAVLGLLAWLFWPRAEAPIPLGGATAETAPAVVILPGPHLTPNLPPTTAPPPVTRPSAPPATPPQAAARADSESDLSPAELKLLRGVATWAGDTLKLTVNNGTAWCVTELYVKVSRFKNEDFVEDPRPILLVPSGAAVDAGVAGLLSRVAPDRKRPGLNPADNALFEGKAGQQPENFRWEIEAARGYLPR